MKPLINTKKLDQLTQRSLGIQNRRQKFARNVTSIFVGILFLLVAIGPVKPLLSQQNDAADWVKRLGDPDPDTRALAEEQLLKLGEQALVAVEASVRADDNEVRLRGKRLLKLLKLKAETLNREAFLAAEPDDQSEYGFKTWPVFQQAAGGNRASRQLFLSIEQHLPQLMAKINQDNNPKLRNDAKNMTEYSTPGQPPSAALAGYLLAHLIDARQNTENPISEIESQVVLNNLLRERFAGAISDESYRAPLQGLAAAWIGKLANDANEYDRLKFRFVYRYKLTSELIRIDQFWDNFDASQKRRWFDCAMSTLNQGDTGDQQIAEGLAKVEAKMDDQQVLMTTCLRSDSTSEIPVRTQDMAMHVWLRLKNQTAEELEFVETGLNFDFSGQPLMGFEDNKKRDNALAALANWQSESDSEETVDAKASND